MEKQYRVDAADHNSEIDTNEVKEEYNYNKFKNEAEEESNEHTTSTLEQNQNSVNDLTINDFKALCDCHLLDKLDVKVEQIMCTERHFDNISTVKELTLHYSQIHLPTLLAVCKELQELHLDNCTLSAAVAAKMVEPVSVTLDNAELRKLTMKSCNGLHSLTFASEHDKLTELTIINCCDLENIVTAFYYEEEEGSSTSPLSQNAEDAHIVIRKVHDYCPSLSNVKIEGCNKLQNIVMHCRLQELMPYVEHNSHITTIEGIEGKYDGIEHTLNVYMGDLTNIAPSMAVSVHIMNVVNKLLGTLNGLEWFTNLQTLNISSCRHLTRLNLTNPLFRLTKLIASNSALINFDFLKMMPKLIHLELDNCTSFSDMEIVLTHLQELEYLSVQNTDISNFDIDSKCLSRLKYLNVKNCKRLSNVHVSSEHPQVEKIIIFMSCNVSITNLTNCYQGKNFAVATNAGLSAIKEFVQLSKITLIRCKHLSREELKLLSECSELHTLELCWTVNISTLEFTTPMIKLNCINACHSSLTTITGLEYCVNLIDLNISNTEITNITGLSKLTKLKELNIGWTKIVNIDDISDCINLEKLYMPHCKSITSLYSIKSGTESTPIQTQTFVLTKLTKLKELDIRWIKASNIDDISKCTSLEILNIARCKRITQLKFTQPMTNLKEILADKSRLSNIAGLENCTNLECLDLNDTRLTSIDHLSVLTRLRKLDIMWLKIKTIDNISEWADLESLNISHCKKITSIEFSKPMTKFKVLLADKSQKLLYITGLQYCYNLERLNISHTRMTTIPALEQFAMLKELDVSWTKINNIERIGKCIKLEKINNSGCDVINQLKFTEQMTNLTSINISFTKSNEIIGLEHCTNLETLNMCYTRITSIAELAKLTKLKELIIGWTRINNIDDITVCTDLQNLNIPFCQHITSLTFTKPMLKLRYIEADNSGLKEIAGLQNCINLKWLNVSNTEITNITGLSKLTKLIYLNVSRTLVSNLNEISECKELSNLNVSDCKNLITLKFTKLMSELEIVELKDSGVRFVEGKEFCPKVSFPKFEDEVITSIPTATIDEPTIVKKKEPRKEECCTIQ